MVGLGGNKGLQRYFFRVLKVWFLGVRVLVFAGVSAVCFGVAQGGLGWFSGFRLYGGGLVFWFVRTRGWCFQGLCGVFCGGCADFSLRYRKIHVSPLQYYIIINL